MDVLQYHKLTQNHSYMTIIDHYHVIS